MKHLLKASIELVKNADLLTGPQLAALLGYTRARIWQLTRDNVIPAVRIGRWWFYKKETVERLLEEGLPNARKGK